MKPSFPIWLVTGLMSCLTVSVRAQEPQWEPEKGETIVILGNTFAERMGLFGYFETFLHARYPEHKLRIRNMGWSADEVAVSPRPYKFGSLEEKLGPPQKEINPREEWFKGLGADSLFLCYGMTESFRGPAGVPYFKEDLDQLLKHHLAQQYNGKSAPKLVLVSPIAHESLGKGLPDGETRSKEVELYVKAMEEVAKANAVPFLNLFTHHREHLMQHPQDLLTFNGIHLTEYGDWVVSQWMAEELGLFDGKRKEADPSPAESLREAIFVKNDRFWIHFRAVNGEYIYGRRKAIGDLPMIPDEEMLRLMEVDEEKDQVVWSMAKPAPSEVWQPQMEH